MLRFAGVSASARPLVTSGMALAMPPVPVLVAAPAPVRRNHSSTVRLDALSAGAAPKVTYWLVPFEQHGLARGDAGRLRRGARGGGRLVVGEVLGRDHVVVGRARRGGRVRVGRGRAAASRR